jgi:hypothetical protein
LLIVCDDTKTAPAYFEALRQTWKERCTIQPKGAICTGATADDLVQFAQSERNNLSSTEGATVYVLIDLEMRRHSGETMTRLRDQNGDGLELIFSQPCFEIWTLSHFRASGKLYKDCDAALQDLKQQWKVQFKQSFPKNKAQADYSKLMKLTYDAIANAKKHAHPKDQSWTEVWRVLEHAKSFRPAST